MTTVGYERGGGGGIFGFVYNHRKRLITEGHTFDVLVLGSNPLSPQQKRLRESKGMWSSGFLHPPLY
jgi:hypothetical protein